MSAANRYFTPVLRDWMKAVKCLCFLVFSLLLPLTHGVEPVAVAPELEPHKKRYDEGIAILKEARATRMAELCAEYLQKLDAAIAIASAAEAVPLKAEREGIVAGLVPTEAPAIKGELAEVRRLYFLACGRAAYEFAEGRKKLATQYLSALGKLRTKGNRTLTNQIAAEKRRIAEGH